MCVGSGIAGVYLSADPTGGPQAWQRLVLDPQDGQDAVSCPTASFCAAVSFLDGNLFVSNNPTGGKSAWIPAHVEPADTPSAIQRGKSVTLNSISCPSPNLCVAADSNDNVLTATDPLGGASAWTRTRINQSMFGLSAVSCPSVSLCLLVDQGGDVFRSATPAGGIAAWEQAQRPSDSFSTIACPDVTFCALAGLNNVYGLSTPATSLAGLATAAIDATNYVNALACPSTALCLAGDSAGNVLIGTPSPPPSAPVPTIISRMQLPFASAHRAGRTWTVDAGIDVRCPAHGPSCSAHGTVSWVDLSHNFNTVTIGRASLTIAAGHQRRVSVVLNAKGAKLLAHGQLILGVTLALVARDGHGAQVADEDALSVVAPTHSRLQRTSAKARLDDVPVAPGQ
jgi:hypothetical protein